MTDAQRFNTLRNNPKYRLERTISKRTQEISIYEGSHRLASKLIVYRYSRQETHYAITDLGITLSNP